MAPREDVPVLTNDQIQHSEEHEKLRKSCQLCYDLQDFEFCYGRHEWQATPVALSESASRGCPSCGVLLGALECYVRPDEEPNAELKMQCEPLPWLRASSGGQYIKIQSSSMSNPVQIYTTEGKSETFCVLTMTDSAANVNQRWPLITLSSHVSEDSSSAECFAKAKAWIGECIEKHEKENCPFYDSGRLPTRVVDVGTSTKQPMLHVSALDQTGTWAALSYRWGHEGRQQLMLTSENLAQLSKGFNVDQLPKTCRDAILAARGLGIQYLWIDALCILQDSREDWERESAAMCHVYRSALVTLAAVDSASAETGLFRSVPGRKFHKLDRNTIADASSEQIFARPTQSHSFGDKFRHGPSPENYMVPDGLNTRAWTFQETLLSPRILWFTAYELVWTCCTGMACECSTIVKKSSLITNRASEDSSAAQEPTFNFHLRTKLSFADKTDWASQWLKLVNAYTKRALTFPSDRLPALSGIAALLAENVGGCYYAGMREVGLVDQLMWTADRHPQYDEVSDTTELIHEYYAPSWSWASVGRGAEISERRLWPSIIPDSPPVWQCEIQGISFRPSQSNIYGPGRGELSLKSKRFALTFHEARRSYITDFRYGVKREYLTHLDFLPEDSKLESFGSIEVTFDPRDYFRWDPDNAGMDADIILIAIKAIREQNSGESCERNLTVRRCHGLACVRVADSGSFRRVGYCHFDLDGEEEWNAWQSMETMTVCLV